jgi:hypothetical protein
MKTFQKMGLKNFRPGFVMTWKLKFKEMHKRCRRRRLSREPPKLAVLATRDIYSKSWPDRIFVFIYSDLISGDRKNDIE